MQPYGVLTTSGSAASTAAAIARTEAKEREKRIVKSESESCKVALRGDEMRSADGSLDSAGAGFYTTRPPALVLEHGQGHRELDIC